MNLSTRNRRRFLNLLTCFALALAPASVVLSQSGGSRDLRQNVIADGGTPANGNYDLQFALWDSQDGGTQIGSTQTVSNVLVSAGIFSVQLDFGANALPGRAHLPVVLFWTTAPQSRVVSKLRHYPKSILVEITLGMRDNPRQRSVLRGRLPHPVTLHRVSTVVEMRQLGHVSAA